jgi:hypothetical protein
MPFGVLSSDHIGGDSDTAEEDILCHQCLSAFCLLTTPLHTWRQSKYRRSHQCLSAFCLLTTGGLAARTHRKRHESPMPFGVLSSDHRVRALMMLGMTLRGHQCLSAFCLLTTGFSTSSPPERGEQVTNAFRRSVF